MSETEKKRHWSLLCRSNYLPLYQEPSNICIENYGQLALHYLTLIVPHIKVRQAAHRKYIMCSGLDTITHVFLLLLVRSKNLAMTNYHCHQACCFYAEFVGQITDEEKMFLRLTTSDAAKYVYKKTIFEMMQHPSQEKEEKEKETETDAPAEEEPDHAPHCRVGIGFIKSVLQHVMLCPIVDHDPLSVQLSLTAFVQKVSSMSFQQLVGLTDHMHHVLDKYPGKMALEHLLQM